MRRLIVFRTYKLCCCYNVKKVEQLVLSEFRSNSSCKQHVNVLRGGGNLKAEGSILLKRESGGEPKLVQGERYWGQGVSILKQNTPVSFQT